MPIFEMVILIFAAPQKCKCSFSLLVPEQYSVGLPSGCHDQIYITLSGKEVLNFELNLDFLVWPSLIFFSISTLFRCLHN